MIKSKLSSAVELALAALLALVVGVSFLMLSAPRADSSWEGPRDCFAWAPDDWAETKTKKDDCPFAK